MVCERESVKRETRLEAVVITQARDAGGFDKGGVREEKQR